MMTRFGILIGALVSAATVPAPVSAQTQAELEQALGNFNRAQAVLGMNASCEVLEYDALLYAQSMVQEVEGSLKRALGDKFDPEATYENARESFEGCKSRKQAPEAWNQIDQIRELGALFTIASSLIEVDPDTCVKQPANPITAEQFAVAAAMTIAKLPKDKQSELSELAKKVAPVLAADCKKVPLFNYPLSFRPAVAKVTALQHLRVAEGEKASPQLAKMRTPLPGLSAVDPWIGPRRSQLTISKPFGSEYYEVTGYRSYKPGRSVAWFPLRSGAMFKGNGRMYFSRDGKIEARVESDFDALVMTTVDGKRSYTFKRTNQGVKPDFFGEKQAEFEMFESERQRFLRENDETVDFHIYYRPTTKGSLKPFLARGSKDQKAKVNMGDFVRAYMWGMAPSAL